MHRTPTQTRLAHDQQVSQAQACSYDAKPGERVRRAGQVLHVAVEHLRQVQLLQQHRLHAALVLLVQHRLHIAPDTAPRP